MVLGGGKCGSKKRSEMWISPTSCFVEGEDCPMRRKGGGYCFLEFTRCDLNQLAIKEQNGYTALLCRIIGSIRRIIEAKTANILRRRKSPFSKTKHWLTTSPSTIPNAGSLFSNYLPASITVSIFNVAYTCVSP